MDRLRPPRWLLVVTGVSGQLQEILAIHSDGVQVPVPKSVAVEDQACSIAGPRRREVAFRMIRHPGRVRAVGVVDVDLVVAPRGLVQRGRDGWPYITALVCG